MPENIITDVVVHKLIKESQQRTATVELRPQPLQVNEAVQRLVDGLYKQYALNVGKAFGKFEQDANEYPVQRYLQEHLNAPIPDFLALSNQLMAHLQTRAAAESFATGGYVLIAKITAANGNHYLLCAIVTEVVGMAITQGLNVVESVHLDMGHLRVAGRIDLTTWLAGGDRYISFLRGRADVSGYFKLFLGCNDLHVPLAESKKLVQALDDFADQNQLAPDAREGLFSLAHSYLSGLSKRGETVELEAFSNHVWPQAPQSLRDVLSEADRDISSGFVPDQRALKRLVKFEGKSQYWKLSFDRKGLLNRDIVFDADNGTLTLKNLPDRLRDELRSEVTDDTDEL